MLTFSEQGHLKLVAAAGISAGTDVLGASHDVSLLGYDSVVYFGTLATFNAGNFAIAQISEDDAAWSDLLPDAESATPCRVSTTVDGNFFLLEIHRPIGGAFQRVKIDRSGANTAHGDIYAFFFNAKDVPVGGITKDALADVAFFDAPELAA